MYTMKSDNTATLSQISDDDEASVFHQDQDNNDNSTTAEHLLTQVNDKVVWPYLALSVSLWLVTPTLICGIVIAFCLIGRLWTCAIFASHLALNLLKVRYHMAELTTIKAAEDERTMRVTTMPQQQSVVNDTEAIEEFESDNDEEEDTKLKPKYGTSVFNCGSAHYWFTTLPSFMDILFFGFLYPLVMMIFYDFFVDADDTLVVEWTHFYYSFSVVRTLGWIIVVLRVCIGTRVILSRRRQSCLGPCGPRTYQQLQNIPLVRNCLDMFYRGWLRFKIRWSTPPHFIGWWHMTTLVTMVSVMIMGWSLFLVGLHVGNFENSVSAPTAICDPLDITECVLPFPSFYHLKQDDTTASGYRVNMSPESVPALKGRAPMPVQFLNNLDGFSTMGPLLFYLEGMKESHNVYADAVKGNPSLKTEPGVTRLRGNNELDLSTTPYSTTLLLDVDSQELVAHSAEIDYLDSERPLVMVFPAQPLRHNTHYALAVINSTDANGIRISPTPGMVDLFNQPQDPRYRTFTKTVLPALERATTNVSNGTGHDWGGPFGAFVRSDDPDALQLLFDFQTVSKESQLGPVKTVRDATISHIDVHWSWKDDSHVRVIQQIEGDCQDPLYPIARTIHAELDVPWFMAKYGPGARGTTLDANAVKARVPVSTGQAKFVVHIPCSVKQAALGQSDAQPLRAVVEFGHGLFGDRLEAGSSYLIRLANENGYIITAMDWRGMSKYDFPVLARTMLTDPSLFESVRDNLIQGYANKFALQHFTHNGLLDKDWLGFSSQDKTMHKIPRRADQTSNDNPQASLIDGQVPSVFYGVSQGGILGAGYVGLSGETDFISRATLGVPGTSFSFIMARSLAFATYNIALLTNFYNGRHVRIFLSLAQMCWDSVEAAGVFAQPIVEPVPPILIQTGLGDAVVPAVAAERLGRALGAHKLPSNPRDSIFGIPESVPGSQTTYQEVLYQEDYDSLPDGNEATGEHNAVHDCVRLDTSLQAQMVEFFNSGEILDPCSDDSTGCVREKARYAKPEMAFKDIFNTKRDAPGSHQVQYCDG